MRRAGRGSVAAARQDGRRSAVYEQHLERGVRPARDGFGARKIDDRFGGRVFHFRIVDLNARGYRTILAADS